MGYNAYWTVYDPGNFRKHRMSLGSCRELARQVNKTVRDMGVFGVYPTVDAGSHLGVPVMRMRACTAEEARVNVRAVRKHLTDLGFEASEEVNAATERALGSEARWRLR